MRIKEEIFHKEIKVGLPQFSNITVGHTITVEVKEGEELNREAVWDVVNQELSIQAGSIDPGWIQTKEYKNFFKTTIKTKKGVK